MPTREQAAAAAKRSASYHSECLVGGPHLNDTELLAEYITQPDSEAEVWKEIDELWESLPDTNRLRPIRTSGGTWGLCHLPVSVQMTFATAVKLRDKLKEMVKPPVPTLKDVELIFDTLGDAGGKSSNVIVPGSDWRDLQNFVRSLKEEA